MIGRRRLLTMTAATAALMGGSAVAAPAAAKPFFGKTTPLGLQLYTVGDQAKADLDGVLARVAAAGYRTVEIAGYVDRTPAQLRASLDRAGLICTSAHISGQPLRPGPSLDGDLNKLAEDAQVIGFKNVVMPLFYIPKRLKIAPQPGESLPAMLGRLGGEMSADEWKWNADYLNEKGRALKALGLTLGYHNHNVEFAPLGDTTGFEIMMRDTDPAVVNFEMDAGWLYAAGQDPLAWLAKHPGRFQAMHVKDVGPKTKPNFALEQEPMEVGAGVIDWRKLLPAARKAGVQRFFVEQEAPFKRDPLESIAISAAYLRMLKA